MSPLGSKELKQDYYIGGLIYGNIYKKQWNTDIISCDFYDLKSDFVAILYSIIDAESVSFKTSKSDFLHPGQAVDVLFDGKEIGYFGQLHPKTKQQLCLS